MKQIITFIFTFLIITSLRSEDLLLNFDSYVEKTMKEWGTPGLAIAIVKDEEIIYSKGFGVIKLGLDEKVDENTIFPIASCSKAFTATALGMLVDEGKITWDEKPKNHLKDFELYDSFLTNEITVKDLLAHRSGLEGADGVWLRSQHSRDELLQKLRFLKPVSSFRSSYNYNNLLYLTAGEMIPAITRISWDDFIKERILIPLEMNRTTTKYSDLEEFSNVASPHYFNKTLIPIKHRNIEQVGPAGCINSCVKDMSKWLILNLNNGIYEGVQILSEKTMEELHSPHCIMPAKNFLSPYHFNLYGLGWMLNDYEGYKVVQHSGALDGMHSQVAMLPEKKLGIVILTNMDLRPITQAMTLHIFDLFLKTENPKDWNSIFLKIWNKSQQQQKILEQQIEEKRIKNTTTSLSLKNYCGKFHNMLYGVLEICSKDACLIDNNKFMGGKLEHWQENTFILDAERNEITFPCKIFYEFIIEDGEVKALHLKSNAGWLILDERFERV